MFPLLPVGCLVWWCFHMAFDAVSRTVATFMAKGSVPCVHCEAALGVLLFGLLVHASFRCVFLLCLSCALEALVAIGRVAIPTCGGRSGALGESLSVGLESFQAVGAVVFGGESILLAVLFWPLVQLCCILPSCGACVCSVLEALSFRPLGHLVLADALWLYHYRYGVAALPCIVVSISVQFTDVLSRTTRMIWVRSSGVGGHCPMCRGVLHMHAIDWFWITIKKLSFGLAVVFMVSLVRVAPVELSTSACVLCVVDVRPVSLRMSEWQAWQSDLSGCHGIPEGRVLVAVWTAIALSGSGLVVALAVRGGEAERRSGEERGGGGRAFPMLPSPAHRDIRGGITQIGCNLITTQLVVAIRIVSRRSSLSRQASCRDVLPHRDLVLLRSPFPSRWYQYGLGGRDSTWLASGVSMALVGMSACASGAMVSIPYGGVLVSRAVSCVPALADGPSGGFRKGCRACLCLLDLSWSQASCVGFCGCCPSSFSFAWCSALESLSARQGGRRQESAAGEQEGWTVCPSLSCLWRWFVALALTEFLTLFLSESRRPSLHSGCRLAMSSAVGLVGLALWAVFSGFCTAGSLEVPCADTRLLFRMVLLVGPQPCGGLRWLCLWMLVLVSLDSSLTWFLRCSMNFFVLFLLLWLVRDWLSPLSLVREAHTPLLSSAKENSFSKGKKKLEFVELSSSDEGVANQQGSQMSYDGSPNPQAEYTQVEIYDKIQPIEEALQKGVDKVNELPSLIQTVQQISQRMNTLWGYNEDISNKLQLVRDEFNQVWKLHDTYDSADSNQATSSAVAPTMPHRVDHLPVVIDQQFANLKEFVGLKINVSDYFLRDHYSDIHYRLSRIEHQLFPQKPPPPPH
ncbi:hypothetical protein Taro_029984 [Colocasia esculenta]|uniref:Uncharacterized protein n=1 Tax=Colocasia esculenta TaxID=4460 RepID=A0A843VQM2_COLES|nr:hypothetical protein [Colocasia esculenta]